MAVVKAVGAVAARGNPMRQPPGPDAPRARAGTVFAVALLLALLAGGCWSLATPLAAAPDEPSHVVEAAALVRGQVTPPRDLPILTGTLYRVRVPFTAASTGALPTCFALFPERSAACQPRIRPDVAPVTAATQFGNYPPLYYGVVGTATRLFPATHELRAVRALSLLCCALLQALAVTVLVVWHPRRAVLLGLAVALVPGLLFLSGVVGSSGVEISAGIATWACWLTLVDRASSPRVVEPPEGRSAAPAPDPWTPRALVVLTVVATTALALSRPLSAPFAAVVVVLSLLAGGRAATVALARTRSVQVAAATLVVVGLGAVGWVAVRGGPLTLHNPGTPTYDTTSALRASAGHVGRLLMESVGIAGWLDTPAPALTLAAWVVALAAVASPALLAPARTLVAATLLVLLCTGGVVLLEARSATEAGLYWQGRYSLPLLAGLPLLLSRALPPGQTAPAPLRRLAPLVVGATVLGQVVFFLATLRRYVTGVRGPLWFFGGPWQPPGTAGLLAVLFTASCLTAGALLLRAAVGGPRRAPARTAVEPRTRPAWS